MKKKKVTFEKEVRTILMDIVLEMYQFGGFISKERAEELAKRISELAQSEEK